MSITLLPYSAVRNNSDGLPPNLNLNDYCQINAASSYYMRVEGSSMEGIGIFHEDIIHVDRSLTAQQGDIVVASLNGGFVIKELQNFPRVALLSYNTLNPPHYVSDRDAFEIFGVVLSVIRLIKRS